MYKILLERRAEKDLDALDGSLRKRIIKRLLLLQDNPRFGSKKLASSKNAWRVRIGDWRIIYEIGDKNKVVKVYRIKHRSRVYK